MLWEECRLLAEKKSPYGRVCIGERLQTFPGMFVPLVPSRIQHNNDNHYTQQNGSEHVSVTE
jgi:hypothetical protein